jgi:CrcB protein
VTSSPADPPPAIRDACSTRLGEGRAPWDGRRALAIALGGAAGAGARWAVLTSVEPGRIPWSVLLVNVAGSLLLGVLLAEEQNHAHRRVLLHDGGAIGFCGGLTTFSTFAMEVVDLARAGDSALAAAYAAMSLVAAVAGVLCGAAAMRRLRAAGLPVEEAT